MGKRTEDEIDQLLKSQEDWPRLLEVVQDRLREIAHRHIQTRDRPYWQTTELLGEINAKLLAGRRFPSGKTQAAFFSYVVTLTRNTLTEEALKRSAAKRGDGAPHDSIEELLPSQHPQEEPVPTIVADHWLDLAPKLEMLEEDDHTWGVILAAIAQGYTLQEIADQLDVSLSTVKEQRKRALKWVKKRLM